MSDPLTDAANAIGDSSPKIKAFSRLAAMRILADEAALDGLATRVAKLEGTPAPPSAGKHWGNGYVLFRYGTSWAASPVSGYERYGVVVVGYGNDGDAAKLTSAHGCGYRTPVELEDVGNAQLSTGGVTLTQARANGWLLKDAAGNELHPSGYSGQWCGNLSHPAYQAACFATYSARATATGLRGFFLDNVVPSPWFGAAPANLYGGLSFDAAYLSFLAAMRKACPDLYFLANAGPGGSAWWTTIAPFVDGLLYETFSGTPAQLATLHAGKQAGRDVYALGFGDPAGVGARAFASAFATVWSPGDGGGFGLNLTGADPWNANWTSVIV